MTSELLSIKKIQQFNGHRAAVYSLDWDSKLGLLSGGGDGWLVNWSLEDPDQGKLLAKIEARIFCISSFAGGLLAGTMKGDLIFLQQIADKWEPRVITAHDKGIFSIYVAANYFLTAGGDGFICKWNFAGEQLNRKKIAPNSIRSMVAHPVDKVLAVSTSAGHIYFIQPELLATVIPPYLNAHDPSVFTSLWSTSGEQLFSGGRDALLKIWSYPDFEAIPDEIKAHLYTINSLAASPDKNLFATGSRDRTIKIWDKTTFALLKVIDVVKNGGHTASVNTLIWNEKGLFSGGDDKKIIQWEIQLDSGHQAKTDS